jgi:hypothetical protein
MGVDKHTCQQQQETAVWSWIADVRYPSRSAQLLHSWYGLSLEICKKSKYPTTNQER